MQVVFSNVSLIEFLSLSLDGPAKWFFFGYFMYITLVVTIAITAIFYNHLESNLGRPIRGNAKYLVWMQLVGMNVGGAAATILLIIFGFVGAGFVSFISGEQSEMQNIMDFVNIPIAGFALVFACGMASGGIAYIRTYTAKRGPKLNKMAFDDSSKYDRL
jgi:hypothetical protein